MLDSLMQRGPMTASQLEEDTGRDRRHVRAVLRRLEACGFVTRVGVAPKPRERPSTVWGARDDVRHARTPPIPIEASTPAVLAALERRRVATAAELAAELYGPLVEELLREVRARGGGAWQAPDGRWVARSSGILPDEVGGEHGER